MIPTVADAPVGKKANDEFGLSRSSYDRTHDGRRPTMRKLKLAMYVSLDGVVEEPAWTGPYWNDQLSDLQEEYLYSSDALVLGRVTYEGFAAAWPGMEE